MRRVTLRRFFENDYATLGCISVDGENHEPYMTLENPLRETSVDSRIPIGEYVVIPYTGTKYKNVYKLTNVVGRTDILIHQGNTEKDTLGCILIGNSAGAFNATTPAVMESVRALDRFRKQIGSSKFLLKIIDCQT